MATAEFSLQVASLYRQESERLRRRARRRLSDVHAAEDVLQDVFKVLSERGNFEGIKSPAGFAHAVMDNLISTRFRLKYLRPEVLTKGPCEGSSETTDLAAEYERKELSARLHQSMNDLLTPRDRYLLALHGLGYRPGEIAQMETEAGRTLTSRQVSWAMYNAMARLRQRLAPESFSGLLLPMWFRRARARILAGGERLALSFGGIDAGSLIAGIAVAALISVGQSARPYAGLLGDPAGPQFVAKIASSRPLLLEDSLAKETGRATVEPLAVGANTFVHGPDSHPTPSSLPSLSRFEALSSFLGRMGRLQSLIRANCQRKQLFRRPRAAKPS
ncbi:MAG: RNA polymerase sigma factor [Actinomycetota bacterium]